MLKLIENILNFLDFKKVFKKILFPICMIILKIK